MSVDFLIISDTRLVYSPLEGRLRGKIDNTVNVDFAFDDAHASKYVELKDYNAILCDARQDPGFATEIRNNADTIKKKIPVIAFSTRERSKKGIIKEDELLKYVEVSDLGGYQAQGYTQIVHEVLKYAKNL